MHLSFGFIDLTICYATLFKLGAYGLNVSFDSCSQISGVLLYLRRAISAAISGAEFLVNISRNDDGRNVFRHTVNFGRFCVWEFAS